MSFKATKVAFVTQQSNADEMDSFCCSMVALDKGQLVDRCRRGLSPPTPASLSVTLSLAPTVQI